MRLGDLDALKSDLKQYFSDGVLDSVSAKLAFNMILRKIDNAPTVEPTFGLFKEMLCSECGKRPQGEWIRTGSLGNGNAHYECSECHYGDEHAESQEVPYCWHCGAEMKGGAENG